ncbi:hypothetical protein KM043_004515 [Ampulex compressa]|nr:hypothetical protein KM043_004515 [Ampulex compressa]
MSPLHRHPPQSVKTHDTSPNDLNSQHRTKDQKTLTKIVDHSPAGTSKEKPQNPPPSKTEKLVFEIIRVHILHPPSRSRSRGTVLTPDPELLIQPFPRADSAVRARRALIGGKKATRS